MKKALVFGPRDLRIVDVPERTPGPGEVKARIVIGTVGDHTVNLFQGKLIPDVPTRNFPVTLCYTAVGQVVETGPGVQRLKVGDYVYPNFYRACGHCDMCRADRAVACREMPVNAMNMMIGEEYESGLQEYLVFPEERLRPVPAGAPIESIAMTGSTSVSMQAVTALDPKPWDTVAIIGSGFLGICAVQICKLYGARVVACDVVPDRLERAKGLGADVTVDVSGENAAQALIEACGGSPTMIIEAAGTVAAAELAFNAAGRGAHIAFMGISPFGIPQLSTVMNGLTIHGIGGANRVQETIELLAAGKIDVTSAITHRFPFSRLAEAIELKVSDPSAGVVIIYVDESQMPT